MRLKAFHISCASLGESSTTRSLPLRICAGTSDTKMSAIIAPIKILKKFFIKPYYFFGAGAAVVAGAAALFSPVFTASAFFFSTSEEIEGVATLSTELPPVV